MNQPQKEDFDIFTIPKDSFLRNRKTSSFQNIRGELSKAFFRVGKELQIGPKFSQNDNKDVTQEEEQEEEQQPVYYPKQKLLTSKDIRKINEQETRITGMIVALVGMILWVIFVSGFLINVNFTNGYPSMRMPPSPGPFKTSRYGFNWVLCYMLYFNILSPFALLSAVSEFMYISRLTLHKMVTGLLLAANIFCFFGFLFIGIFYCNNTLSLSSSVCNSPLICCVFGFSNLPWCPTPSICTPTITYSTLGWQDNFYWIWIFTVFFGLYCFFSLAINKNLSKISITSAINVASIEN